MSITKKTIALVIVTYNRCNLLMEMLTSIEKMSDKPDIVYVIDNNSSDNTSSVVTQCDSRKNININNIKVVKEGKKKKKKDKKK